LISFSGIDRGQKRTTFQKLVTKTDFVLEISTVSPVIAEFWSDPISGDAPTGCRSAGSSRGVTAEARLRL
jgi:hypothetical protein